MAGVPISSHKQAKIDGMEILQQHQNTSDITRQHQHNTSEKRYATLAYNQTVTHNKYYKIT